MVEEKQLFNDFKTFFVSQDTCLSPLLSEIIKIGDTLNNKKMGDFIGSISLSYGKRMLINSNDSDIRKIKNQDIIEIVNYDPIKNIVLAIGKKNPNYETPIHWIIQQARHDVNTILKISNEKIYNLCKSRFPIIEDLKSNNIIDKVKIILKELQKTDKICIDNGIILVGMQIIDIKNSLKLIFEDLK